MTGDGQIALGDRVAVDVSQSRLLPGIRLNTSASDSFPIKQMRRRDLTEPLGVDAKDG